MKTTLTSPYKGKTFEVELHYKRPVFDTMFSITNANDANTVLRSFINPKRLDLKECFWVILLSNANKVLGLSEIGSGTTESVHVNIKEIFQLALLTNASAFIVAHNHPSGKLKISKSDLAITERIQKLAKPMGFTLLDHIIITSEAYISFAEQDQL